MENSQSENGENDEHGPYKNMEFDKFIETLKDGQVAHWVQIAQALGVGVNTITRWKKKPEAQKAIQEGIDHALACMQQAGARDWRMWEAKLKLFGVDSTTKVDVTSGGEPVRALVEMVGDEPADSQN